MLTNFTIVKITLKILFLIFNETKNTEIINKAIRVKAQYTIICCKAGIYIENTDKGVPFAVSKLKNFATN